MKTAELKQLGVPAHVISVIPEIEECTRISVNFREIDRQAAPRLGMFVKAPAVLDIDAEAQAITIWLTAGKKHAHAITHELLHLKRDILNSVPRWVPSSRASDAARDFVWQMEAELEHLFVIPEEIACHADARQYWSDRYDQLIDDAASRQDGFALCLHWAFLRTTMCAYEEVVHRCADRLRSLSNHNWLRIAHNYQCEVKAAMPRKPDLMDLQRKFFPWRFTGIRAALYARAVRCIGRAALRPRREVRPLPGRSELQLIPIPCHSFPSSDVKRVQLRIHNDRMAPGICVNLFQASQQASTISS